MAFESLYSFVSWVGVAIASLSKPERRVQKGMNVDIGDARPGPKPLVPFFILWSGQAVSILGSRLAQFALIWWLTVTSDSATVLATASFVGLLPAVVLGPIIGVLVDRWNRKRILFLADSVVALTSLVLAALFFFGEVALWQVYLILFVRAVGSGFHEPTMMASTSLMVPEQHLSRVQGMNQTLAGVSGVAAAPLGALLLAYLPLEAILAIDAATALFGVVPLLFIVVPQPPRPEVLGEGALRPLQDFWRELSTGFHFVRGWTGLFLLLCLCVAINMLFTPAFALLPLFVKNHFGGGALQLGALEAAFGAGMIAGGMLLSVWGGFKRRIVTTLVGIAVAGLSLALLSAVPATLFPLALVSQAVLGGALPIINGPLFAALQAVVPPDLQGRVFTLVMSLASGAAPLGLLLAGPTADLVGIRPLFLACGLLCLLISFIGFRLPVILQLEEHRGASASLQT